MVGIARKVTDNGVRSLIGGPVADGLILKTASWALTVKLAAGSTAPSIEPFMLALLIKHYLLVKNSSGFFPVDSVVNP